MRYEGWIRITSRKNDIQSQLFPVAKGITNRKNPAEEIVTAWLQECKGYFTMNNHCCPVKIEPLVEVHPEQPVVVQVSV